MLDERKPHSEAVLRSETAERQMQGLTGHERLTDACEVTRGEGGAWLNQLLPAVVKFQPLAAKVGVYSALVATSGLR